MCCRNRGIFIAVVVVLLLVFSWNRFFDQDGGDNYPEENQQVEIIENQQAAGDMATQANPGLEAIYRIEDEDELLLLLNVEEKPDKLLKIPALCSPETTSPNDNPKVNELINAYNHQQDQLKHVTLIGSCSWGGSGRPFCLEFNRQTRRTFIECGDQRCECHSGVVLAYHFPQGAMQVDSCYLLALRKFDPSSFTTVSDDNLITKSDDEIEVKQDVTKIASEKETIYFDSTSNQLVRAEVSTDFGIIRADFSDFIQLKGKDEEVTFPGKISVYPPAELFQFENPPKRIVLRLNPDISQLGEIPVVEEEEEIF